MKRTLVAAPDKFKGTATAAQVAKAIETAADGWNVDMAPMADGGDGTLDVFDGPRRTTRVTGPLGEAVDAEWIMRDGLAVIEVARACGLMLVGGGQNNDPMAASSIGAGELIADAMKRGAERVLVGLGGVASTDGGLGALDALRPHARLNEVDIELLVDTNIAFIDAPRMYGPQKGATPAQVQLLERRLQTLAVQYENDFGVDVHELPGAGAAGGLAGGLAAAGARIVSGFWRLAEEVNLEERIAAADLVVTGEGRLDEQSFTGKVLSGVLEMAKDKQVIVVVGSADPEALHNQALGDAEVLVLADMFGEEMAMANPVATTVLALQPYLDED